ncbi:M15 family metallopeptidase [Aquipuribacter sp. MA13-6]|uniref:M15 family metallopeptidase n=1 Tax=unclassified Aquipuribacter TaxID=2635084 RepID=UPI003EEF7E83
MAVLLVAVLSGCAPAGAPADGGTSTSASAATAAASGAAGVRTGPVLGPPTSGADVGPPSPASHGPSAVTTPTSPTVTAEPSRPVLGGTPDPRATPAPEWVGTRALGPAGSGPVPPQTTPPELLDRRILTVDVLQPPVDGQFTSSVGSVPDDVLARSTWEPACPVAADDLRYVLVAFWGFDGRPHTGEVLLHRDAADAVVAAFAAMHADRFPLEEVRVVAREELDLAPTGDGNVTSAFVCRPTTGGGGWSEHAHGRALDVNPFHNPYDRGTGEDRVVIPELATAYTDRDRRLPGMLLDDSAVVRAFRDEGWTWGGDYRTLADWQHFSASGG